MFYLAVVASTLFYLVVCGGSRLKAEDTNRVNKIIKILSSAIWIELDFLGKVSKKIMVDIMNNRSHTVHSTPERQEQHYGSVLYRSMVIHKTSEL